MSYDSYFMFVENYNVLKGPFYHAEKLITLAK